MNYAFGCSTNKWYWPSWVDWYEVYIGNITNFAFVGYGNQNIYWSIMDKIDTFTPNDHLYITWTQNHRITLWYDIEWINQKDCLGFFPDTNGKLWHTQKTPYRGMYRTHPDQYTSLTNMIIEQFPIILQTQMLLDKHNIKYTMMFAYNPWTDCRPIFKPKYTLLNVKRNGMFKHEIKMAKDIMTITPVKNLLNQIDWTNFIDAPADILDPTAYLGIFDYALSNKEFVLYSHTSDLHPSPLTHHDFLLEKIMKADPSTGRHRNIAKKMSIDCMNIPLPEQLEQHQYVAEPEETLLNKKFKQILLTLK